MKPRVIGLTGGIASGKTEAALFLESLGAGLIDADRISREVILIPEIHRLLKTTWPQAFENDSLNRKKLRQVIFASKEEREKLNQLLHPVIVKRIVEEIQKCTREVCVVMAPLLIEAGLHQMVDEVWVISAPKEFQVKRLLERDEISEKEASAMIESQLSTEEKIAHSHHMFTNNGTLDHLKSQLKKEWNSLMQNLH